MQQNQHLEVGKASALAHRHMLSVIATSAALGLASAPHCALMCGPLGMHASRRPLGSLQYQLGRVASYLALGAAAGWLGAELFAHVWTPGASVAMSFVLAAALFIAAIKAWPRRQEPSETLVSVGKRAPSLAARVLRLLPSHPFFLGLATPLLPCAVLWSAVAVAASTASPLAGSVALASFAVVSGAGILLMHPLAKLLRRGRNGRRGFSLVLAAGAVLVLARTQIDLPSADAPAHCPLHAARGAGR